MVSTRIAWFCSASGTTRWGTKPLKQIPPRSGVVFLELLCSYNNNQMAQSPLTRFYQELKRRKVIRVAIVGFPIALVLAWALELTPEGVRLESAPSMVSGNTERALDLLEEHAKKGGVHADWLVADSDWDGVRDHPRYKAVLELVR